MRGILVLALTLPAWARGESKESNCSDGRDDDADQRIDCADADCCGHPACPEGCLAFSRGDVDNDGSRTVTDAILVLLVLFGGEEISCPDAADLDDNERLDLADPIYLLRYIFQQGPSPPHPLFCAVDGIGPARSLGCDPQHCT